MADTNERGPTYGTQLIDTLPLGSGSMLQAMPSRNDLEKACKVSERTVSGYEVLLAHWRDRCEEVEFLKSIVDSYLHQRKCWKCGNVAYHKDNKTPYVNCSKCGSQDTRLVK